MKLNFSPPEFARSIVISLFAVMILQVYSLLPSMAFYLLFELDKSLDIVV